MLNFLNPELHGWCGPIVFQLRQWKNHVAFHSNSCESEALRIQTVAMPLTSSWRVLLEIWNYFFWATISTCKGCEALQFSTCTLPKDPIHSWVARVPIQLWFWNGYNFLRACSSRIQRGPFNTNKFWPGSCKGPRVDYPSHRGFILTVYGYEVRV